MSDQNQFDQMKQKLLHYWGLFLAACGRLWGQVKEYTKKGWDFLSRYAKIVWDFISRYAKIAWDFVARYAKIAWDFLSRYAGIAWEKLKIFGAAVGRWLKKVWAAMQPYCKRVLQVLAAWLLLAREKLGPAVRKVTDWIKAAAARVRAMIGDRMQQVRALPEGEDNIVDAEDAQLVETAEETTVEEEPKPEPAWKSVPWMVKAAAVFAAIGVGIKFVCKWIGKLYKVFMAAPVIWAALKFAMQNLDRLPEQVGLDIQSTGEFARMISREQAVWWPFGITMFCLVLMFTAKKPILPWVISIFTLVLPWLIWILNYYA